MDPEEITVIVYRAANLPCKKKGRPKFSVIFGVGSKKFRTATVTDPAGNPVWNEESTILVDNAHHDLSFCITDKDTVLGQVVVPVSSLPPALERKKTQTKLLPHKKCPEPQGEIVFDAWVTRHKASILTPRFSTTSLKLHKPGPFQKLRDILPIHRHRSTTFDQPGQLTKHRNQREFQSVCDLPVAVYKSLSETSLPIASQIKASSCSHIDNVTSVPEVTGISPKEGTIIGGTRLIIRGQNLGLTKEDVVGLNICGSNCLASLEYESPQKLTCTTKPWHATTGHVLVTTQSGGRGLSVVQFTFTEDNKPAMKLTEKGDKTSRGLFGMITGGEMKGKDKTKQDLVEELYKLRRENQSLHEENRNMRLYVDKLVAKVMDSCPQVLQYPI